MDIQFRGVYSGLIREFDAGISTFDRNLAAIYCRSPGIIVA